MGAAIYWYISSGGTQQSPITADQSENQIQTEFQALVGELSPISFDTKIFSDPRFTVLVNLTTPISPEPFGRMDPFAPIAGLSEN